MIIVSSCSSDSSLLFQLFCCCHNAVGNMPPQMADLIPIDFEIKPSMLAGVWNLGGMSDAGYDPPNNWTETLKKIPQLEFNQKTGSVVCGVCKRACENKVIDTSKWVAGVYLPRKRWSEVGAY